MSDYTELSDVRKGNLEARSAGARSWLDIRRTKKSVAKQHHCISLQ